MTIRQAHHLELRQPDRRRRSVRVLVHICQPSSKVDQTGHTKPFPVRVS